MTKYIREIIAESINTDELQRAIYDAMAERIDYNAIAEEIAETVSDEEIAEIALDIFLNG